MSYSIVCYLFSNNNLFNLYTKQIKAMSHSFHGLLSNTHPSKLWFAFAKSEL